jgi:arylsulfatase A-like enzyme
VTVSRVFEAIPEKPAIGHSARSAKVPDARVSGALSALVGWLAVAIVNVVWIARMPLHAGAFQSRLVHVLYDFGQTMALGLASFGIVWAWTKWGPRRRRVFDYLGVALFAIAVFQFVLPEDLEGFVDRWTDSRGGEPTVRALAAVLSLAILACFAFGRLLARGALRAIPVVSSFALIVANGYVLVNGYPGAHFWIACSGATLLSASLAGARVPPAVAGYFGERAKLVAFGAVSLVALASLVVPPPGRVVVELLQRDTAFIAPAITRLTASDALEEVEVPRELEPWFTPRARRPDVAPSSTRLVPGAPIVILVTIDALRLEVMTEKNARVAPTLHAMREQGIYLSQARSYGSDTRYSLAALFSGRYFSMLNWTRGVRPTLEKDQLPRLPELLGKREVHTVFGNTLDRMFSPEFRILGSFGEEFVTEDGENPKGTPAVIDAAIERLKRHGDGPLFYYAHLLDPHGPYVRHRKRASSPRNAYLGEVTHADGHLGRLRAAIRELGLAHRTMLIVSSDHGEAFGEHGLWRHNKPLYEVMVHVPMLVEYPGVTPRVAEEHVSLMDLGPTILDVFGVPTPGYWMGESLVPLLAGESSPSRRPILMGRPKEDALLFADGMKVILRRGGSRSEEIYDLRRDPDEEDNLRDSLGRKGDRLVALAKKYTDVHRWPDGVRPPAPH